MPDLQAHLRSVAEKQQQEKIEAEKAVSQETLEYAVNRLQVLSKLKESPEVKQFLKMLVQPMVTEEHDSALDPKQTDEQAGKHRQRYDIANEILGILAAEHAHWFVIVQEKSLQSP